MDIFADAVGYIVSHLIQAGHDVEEVARPEDEEYFGQECFLPRPV